VRSVGLVLQVRVLADAGGAPRVDVEAFAAHQPVLANLLRASWHELESLTVAAVAVILDTTALQERLVVRLEEVAAEAARG